MKSRNHKEKKREVYSPSNLPPTYEFFTIFWAANAPSPYWLLWMQMAFSTKLKIIKRWKELPLLRTHGKLGFLQFVVLTRVLRLLFAFNSVRLEKWKLVYYNNLTFLWIEFELGGLNDLMKEKMVALPCITFQTEFRIALPFWVHTGTSRCKRAKLLILLTMAFATLVFQWTFKSFSTC